MSNAMNRSLRRDTTLLMISWIISEEPVGVLTSKGHQIQFPLMVMHV